MFNSFKHFFDSSIKPERVTAKEVTDRSLQLATVALYIEMMHADREVTDEERAKVSELIHKKFDLSQEETDDLIRLAKEETKQSLSYYEFTTLINKGFTLEQKIRIIENLWEIAFVDGHADNHEEHMVRKVAGLIFVEHKDFIDAKLRVRDRLGLS